MSPPAARCGACGAEVEAAALRCAGCGAPFRGAQQVRVHEPRVERGAGVSLRFRLGSAVQAALERLKR